MTSRRDRPYPKRIPIDEQPEPTPDNVPDEILRDAVKIATGYGSCPKCDTRQWYNTVAGYNTSHECVECEFTMRIVG